VTLFVYLPIYTYVRLSTPVSKHTVTINLYALYKKTLYVCIYVYLNEHV